MKDEPIYTIKQTAEHTGIAEDTIRYYEKIALLPRADRKENGHRVYRQDDIQTLRLIACLKKTGMPLEEMRPFLAVTVDADPADHPELVEHLRSHREKIVGQIAQLQQVVEFIDLKLEEGKYRRDCADEPGPKTASPEEMSYFSGAAKAGKPTVSL